MTGPGRLLRKLVESRAACLVPGAANALAARIIVQQGFEAVYVTGAGIANTFLGVPDIGLVTLTELASHVAAIRDAVPCPLIVDGDTGFGNAVSVGHTVRVLERSGANAIQLEDQIFPKRCGHFAGKSVVPVEEMIGKIHAAVDARSTEEMLVIARTDARSSAGFDVAIERASRYLEAGADMTFVEAPQSEAEVEAIARLLAAPQVYNAVFGGLTPLLSLETLRQHGYGIALYANAALQASVRAMSHVLRSLHQDGTLESVSGYLADFSERQTVVDKIKYDELERLYAGI
jgi:2-methylisocitrate lyase-like PEP mutase family enzyme